MKVVDHIGNIELLKLPKTAFLCSREIPASIVLKCYDWAIAQREQGNCIIGGFHSKIEKDVLHYLLKGDQPIIVVMARGLKQRLEPELKSELKKGRLLIISPFEKEVKRITTETAIIRNQLMIDLAKNVAVGFISKGGNLEKLLKQAKKAITLIG
jgi:predicted Rossmann fold nucleotide-binding protein DprA/Smf involved in DNA uptake